MLTKHEDDDRISKEDEARDATDNDVEVFWGFLMCSNLKSYCLHELFHVRSVRIILNILVIFNWWKNFQKDGAGDAVEDDVEGSHASEDVLN